MVECWLLIQIQIIKILNTAFFSKIKQIKEELCKYSLIRHTKTHLTVALEITLQNFMEEH